MHVRECSRLLLHPTPSPTDRSTLLTLLSPLCTASSGLSCPVGLVSGRSSRSESRRRERLSLSSLLSKAWFCRHGAPVGPLYSIQHSQGSHNSSFSPLQLEVVMASLCWYPRVCLQHPLLASCNLLPTPTTWRICTFRQAVFHLKMPSISSRTPADRVFSSLPFKMSCR